MWRPAVRRSAVAGREGFPERLSLAVHRVGRTRAAIRRVAPKARERSADGPHWTRARPHPGLILPFDATRCGSERTRAWPRREAFRFRATVMMNASAAAQGSGRMTGMGT